MSKIIWFVLIYYICLYIDVFCGVIRVKRVIGGEPENSSDYGYLVILIGKKGYSWDLLKLWGEHRTIHCSGTLVNDQWILTAAHCFTLMKDVEEEKTPNDDKNENEDNSTDIDKDEEYSENEVLRVKGNTFEKVKNLKEIIDFSNPEYWKVRLAVKTLEPTMKERFTNFWNIITEKSTKKTYYYVSKVIRHPDYTPWNLENDVALLKLSEKLNITEDDGTKIIALSNNKDEETFWPLTGQVCKVLGWGCTTYDGPIMNIPHSVNLPVLSPSYCRRIYRADINLTESQEFCAGYYDKNIGICSGDSGGPLVCSDYGQSVLAGVASATHINNPSKYPGIFSRISFFRSWINHVIDNE